MEILRFDFDGLQHFSLHLQAFQFVDQFLRFVLVVLDSLLVIGYLPKQLSINSLFIKVFMDQIFGIIDSSGSLDLLEGKLHHLEFLHLLLNLVPQHLVDEDVGEEDLPPVLLVHVLVLNGPFGDLVEVGLSCLVGV
jgi:hypothetical protein